MKTYNPQTRLLELLQPLITRPIRAATQTAQPARSLVNREKTRSAITGAMQLPAALERLYPHGIRELDSPLAD